MSLLGILNQSIFMILSLSFIDFNDNDKDNDHNLDDTNDNIQGSFTFVFPPLNSLVI